MDAERNQNNDAETGMVLTGNFSIIRLMFYVSIRLPIFIAVNLNADICSCRLTWQNTVEGK